MSCHVCGACAVEPCQSWCSEHPSNFAAAKALTLALSNLAANLSVAAFGQAMFRAGVDFRDVNARNVSRRALDLSELPAPWRPNAQGKPARVGAFEATLTARQEAQVTMTDSPTPLDVACPTCGEPLGKPCASAGVTHGKRRRLAAALAPVSKVPDDAADVTICHVTKSDVWCFWESEYPEDMVIGPFDDEQACRAGVEDFYKVNNPFGPGQTEYVITRATRRNAQWGDGDEQVAALREENARLRTQNDRLSTRPTTSTELQCEQACASLMFAAEKIVTLRALLAEALTIGQRHTRALRAIMPNADRIAADDERLAEITKESP